MSRLDLIARDWIGTPFRHQGRTRHGIDCVGLLYVCCESLPAFAHYLQHDIPGYSREPHEGLLEAGLEAAFGRPVFDLQAGDVVACAFPRAVRHVAIVGDHINGGLSLIHTWNAVGEVVEHNIDKRWLRRIRRIYRPEPI